MSLHTVDMQEEEHVCSLKAPKISKAPGQLRCGGTTHTLNANLTQAAQLASKSLEAGTPLNRMASLSASTLAQQSYLLLASRQPLFTRLKVLIEAQFVLSPKRCTTCGADNAYK